MHTRPLNARVGILIYIFLILSIISVLGLIYIFIFSFKLKTVKIYGSNEIIFALDKYDGQNLLLLNTQKIREDILKNNFLVKNAKVNKVYPDSLDINIDKRQPFVILDASPSGILVSLDGIVLKKVTDNDLDNYPIMTIFFSGVRPKIGDTLDSDIKNTLSLVNDLKNTGFTVKKIKVDTTVPSGIIVLTDDTEIDFSLTKSNAKLAPSLQIIIGRFRIEGKILSKIDFRFEKPIITFKNGVKISP